MLKFKINNIFVLNSAVDEELLKMQVLKEIIGGKRAKVYIFDNYIKLFK